MTPNPSHPLPSEPDLAALERLAKAAKEDGGWHNAAYLNCFVDGDDAPVFDEADTAFIEAVTPDVVLGLLATLNAARSSPAPAEGLDAAWAEAEAALPPGAYLTTIIEAWSAHGPEGRRIYHDGLLHGRSGFAAALRAIAARLSSPVDRDAGEDGA